MSPFSNRGKHQREDCPKGGKHTMRHVYSGRACQISQCTKCKDIKWRAYRSRPDYAQIRLDLEAFKGE